MVLKLNESLIQVQEIQNKMIEIESKINDTKIILIGLEKDYKSTSDLFENLQGDISKQKIETQSAIKVLDENFSDIGLHFDYDFDMNIIQVKESENLVDCFEYNDNSGEFEQNVLISKAKFSSKKVHILYCEGISFIYEQLEKLVK